MTTDGTGTGTFSLTLPQGIYTSTATNSAGSTSGFSSAVGTAPLPATTTVVTSSPNPSNVGQQVTFTAVVTASGFSGTPTGTVTFTIDGQAQTPVALSLAGSVDEAQFSTATLAAGQHTVSAAYSGDSNVGPSSGSLPNQVVNGPTLKASTTTLSSSMNPSAVGQQVTFTAVVSAASYQGTPTGTITFTIDGHAEAPVQLAVGGGQDEATFTTSTLAAGQHSVTAAYSGDTYVSSSSGSLPSQVVNAPALKASTTTLSSSANPSTVGQQVTFTAVVSAASYQGTPTGTVTFTIDGHAQAPVQLAIVGGQDEATLITSTLTAGQHSVTAAYSGDAHVSSSTGSLPTEVVNAPSLQATTTVLTSSVDPSTVGQSVTFTAIVSAAGTAGSPTGSVVFTIDGVSEAPAPLQVVNGKDEAVLAISSLAKGSHMIRAAYSGDASFSGNGVGSTLVQTVNPAAPPNGDGPTIESVKRFGVHMHPTVLVISFNDPLDPVSAVNLTNYRVTNPAGQLVRIKSAVFDAQSNTVTLHPAYRINLHHTYRFEIIGTGASGVRNTEGLLLDGAGNGTPSSNYSGTLTWRNAVLTPAQIAKYCASKPLHAGRPPEPPFCQERDRPSPRRALNDRSQSTDRWSTSARLRLLNEALVCLTCLCSRSLPASPHSTGMRPTRQPTRSSPNTAYVAAMPVVACIGPHGDVGAVDDERARDDHGRTAVYPRHGNSHESSGRQDGISAIEITYAVPVTIIPDANEPASAQVSG